MFLFRYALVSLLLPPGIFILGFALTAAWALLARRRRLALLCGACAAALWLCSITPSADLALAGLESSYYDYERSPRGDVIVLLGGGYSDTAIDLSGDGAPSREAMARMVQAARLHRRLGLPIVATGGSYFGMQISEARIYKRFLSDLGVAPGRVLVEGNSVNTMENASRTKALLAKQGLSRPILVTSAFHMRRASLAFELVDLQVMPSPSSFRTRPSKAYGPEDFCPTAGSMAELGIALREYIGLFYYLYLL